MSFNLTCHIGQLDMYTMHYEFLKLTLESGTFSGLVYIEWWFYNSVWVTDCERYFSLKIELLLVSGHIAFGTTIIGYLYNEILIFKVGWEFYQF